MVGLKRKTILDAEAGKGRFIIDFLNYGSLFILALEASRDMLPRATKSAGVILK